MPSSSDREALRNLLIRAIALETAENLGRLSLPPRLVLDKYEQLASSAAEQALRKYETELTAAEVSTTVLRDLGAELRSRSRVGRIIEIGFDISLLIEAALLGVSHLILDVNKNAEEIRIVYYILLFVVSMQLIANGYLKFFSRSKA